MRSVFSPAKIAALTAATITLSHSGRSEAQNFVGSYQFQELFTTAGYSALFGAALGTAILPFVPDNSFSNLRIVAGGASLGFVLGSVMAIYGLRQQQNQQTFGAQYYQDTDTSASESSEWHWDIGTSSGKDVFVRLDSRY